jgi:hypothetical protein
MGRQSVDTPQGVPTEGAVDRQILVETQELAHHL